MPGLLREVDLPHDLSGAAIQEHEPGGRPRYHRDQPGLWVRDHAFGLFADTYNFARGLLAQLRRFSGLRRRRGVLLTSGFLLLVLLVLLVISLPGALGTAAGGEHQREQEDEKQLRQDARAIGHWNTSM